MINIVDPKSLGTQFTGLLEDGVPVFTFYNGNANVLQMAVAKAVMDKNSLSRPRFISGHGFNLGTTGSISDLEKYLGFDTESILKLVLKEMGR